MVDSSDRERIEEAGKDLAGLLEADDREEAIVLVLANKQDIENGKQLFFLILSHCLQRMNLGTRPLLPEFGGAIGGFNGNP